MNNDSADILIIKTGSTYPDIKNGMGDFDNWIRQTCYNYWENWVSKKIEDVQVDQLHKYCGVIFTGAHESVCNDYPHISRASDIMDKIVDHKIPTFGICFAHQLINKLFGGKVIKSPNGLEFGVVDIKLSLEGMADSWFIDSKSGQIKVYESHEDIVIDSGVGFDQLAWNDVSIYQATKYKDYIRTVQFHPEFYKPILIHYLRKNMDKLRNQYNKSLDQVKSISKVINNKAELPMNDEPIINFVKYIDKVEV